MEKRTDSEHILEIIDCALIWAEEVIISSEAESRKVEEMWSEFEAHCKRLEADGVFVPLRDLAGRFGLDTFSLRVLLLCMAIKLDSKLRKKLASRVDGPELGEDIRVEMLMELLCRDRRVVIRSRRYFGVGSSLVHHRLLLFVDHDDSKESDLLYRRVTISQGVVDYILGELKLDSALSEYCQLIEPKVSFDDVILKAEMKHDLLELVKHHADYRFLVDKWRVGEVSRSGTGIVLLFAGPSGTGKTHAVFGLANKLKKPLIFVHCSRLSESMRKSDEILKNIYREAAITNSIVLLDECETIFREWHGQPSGDYSALEEFPGITIMTTNLLRSLDVTLARRIIRTFVFERPDMLARQQIWEGHLTREIELHGGIDLWKLASQYEYTGAKIKNAILVALNKAASEQVDNPVIGMRHLISGAESQIPYVLEDYAERTMTALTLDDIVLPPKSRRLVEKVISKYRNRPYVLNTMGFRKKFTRGLGIVAVFAGHSGTGKTYAAEIISGELGLPLHRVHIPQIMSKWVGDTEKHLEKLFEHAQASHAILLFDEAEALFGKRGTIERASDRYANLEVNYLLQRIERYPGIVILTTNNAELMDPAFKRRISVRVNFELPGAEERAKIWEVLFPTACPHEELDFVKLGHEFELTGSDIKEALLWAADEAAIEKRPITQDDLYAGAIELAEQMGKVLRDPRVDLKKPSEILRIELDGRTYLYPKGAELPPELKARYEREQKEREAWKHQALRPVDAFSHRKTKVSGDHLHEISGLIPPTPVPYPTEILEKDKDEGARDE